MDDFLRVANQFGIPWAIALGSLIGFFRLAKYLVEKLVNDEINPSTGQAKGLIDRAVSGHIKTMQVMQEQMQEQTLLIKEALSRINCPKPVSKSERDG